MPLPTPGNESASEYVSKCVSFIFREGTLNGKKMNPKNAHDRKIATAACYSNYRSSKKSDDVIIHAGLKDKNGYFCRVEGLLTRHYYDINNENSKVDAKQKAMEEWINLQVDTLVKQTDPDGDIREPPIDGGENTNPPSEDRNKRDEFMSTCIARRTKEGESESSAKEKCQQEWDSKNKSIEYTIPKSKDELKSGDIISYKGKVAKVVKVLEK